MRLTHLTILALATFSLGTLALRAEETKKERPRGEGFHKKALEKFDANGDGKLDETERAAAKEARKAHHEERVAKFDANGDGKLEPAERQAAKEARKEFRQNNKGNKGNKGNRGKKGNV